MALKEKLIDKAQKLIQKGYLDKAIVEYRAAADADPKDITIRLRIGDLYVKTGKKTDAVKEYAEAARANAQRGFYLKAIAVYKQVLKLEDTIETRNKLADLYLKQRLIADAIGEYSYIVSWFEQRGKTSEVLELLKKMVNIDPENVGVRLKLAELYQKLSFKEDALSEYSSIFEKLLSAGKLDTAEKIYLNLYSSNPADERVLSGLSELYKRKGDDGQRLKFLKGLLNHYSNAAMDEDARMAALDIVKISPGDPHASKFLKKSESSEAIVQPSAEGGPEPFSVASSMVTEPAVEAAAVEAAFDGLPEEEIEITIEGFDEGPSEAGALTMQTEEAASAVEEKASESSSAVSGSMDSDGAPEHPHAGAATPIPCSDDEVEIDIEEFLSGEAPQVETAAGQSSAVETSVEADVPQAPVEEQAPEQTAAAVEPVNIELSEDAGIEEALSIISTELLETGAADAPQDETAALPEETAPASCAVEVVEAEPLAVTGNEPLLEIAPDAAEPVEAAAMEVIDIKPEALVEEPEPAAPAPELVEVTVEPSIPVETAYVVEESPASAAPVEAAQPQVEVLVETPAPVEAAPGEELVAVEPAPEEEEVREEDLSSAIQELMEKMEPAEAEAQEAPRASETSAPAEEYVDLSAELGMAEALKDLAEPWGGKESAETFDEFKDGIGKQLSKEDSETHYNLGIAYMEMELFGEASKEFKIALKDARLELDCYTRLGLCAMAENNPDEAAVYYSKGLKAAVRSDEEKKGLMYELALAYEASGRDEDAYILFQGIFEMDPEFREAALKVSAFVSMRPCVPLNDGFIEVEFL